MAAVCLFQYHTNTNEQILTGLSLFGSLESNIKSEVRTVLCFLGLPSILFSIKLCVTCTLLHVLRLRQTVRRRLS